MKLSRKKITKLLKGNHQTRKRCNKRKPSKKRGRSFRKKRPVNLRRKSIRRRRNSRGGAKLQIDDSKWKTGSIPGFRGDPDAKKIELINKYNRALAEYVTIVDKAYVRYNKSTGRQQFKLKNLNKALDTAKDNFLSVLKQEHEGKLKSSWMGSSKELMMVTRCLVGM